MRKAAAICAPCPRTLRYFERSWCRRCRDEKLRAAGLYPADAGSLARGFLAQAA